MFKVKTILKKIKYKKMNKHNFTEIKQNIDISKVKIGKGTYGTINIKTYKNGTSKLRIGNYCSIADETVFLLGGEHNYKKISTYPFKAKYLDCNEYETKGDIIVNDDVWIGYGCTILSGVNIGQGAIIGAKTVVAKDIPPYAIYCGNRIIKYRFNEEIIKELLKIDFSKIDEKFIKENIESLYKDVNKETLRDIIEKIKRDD